MVDVRQFLGSVREAKIEIQRCKSRIQQMQDQAVNITSSWSDMPKGPSKDNHKDSVLVAIADQTNRLEKKQAIWMQRLNEVEDFIDGLPTPVYRIILKLRYVDLLTWPEVTSQLEKFTIYYTERHVTRLHGYALQEAKKKWEELNRYVDSNEQEEDQQEVEK